MIVLLVDGNNFREFSKAAQNHFPELKAECDARLDQLRSEGWTVGFNPAEFVVGKAHVLMGAYGVVSDTLNNCEFIFKDEEAAMKMLLTFSDFMYCGTTDKTARILEDFKKFDNNTEAAFTNGTSGITI